MANRFWNWLTGKKTNKAAEQLKVEHIVNLGYSRNDKTGKKVLHGDWKDKLKLRVKGFFNQLFKGGSKRNSQVADRASAEFDEIGKKTDFSRDERGRYVNSEVYIANDKSKYDDAYKREVIIEDLEEKKEMAEDDKSYNMYLSNVKNAEKDGFVVYESGLDENEEKTVKEVKSENLLFREVNELTENEKKVLAGKLDALDLEREEAKAAKQKDMEEDKDASKKVMRERTSFSKEFGQNEKIVPFERYSHNPVKSKCMGL